MKKYIKEIYPYVLILLLVIAIKAFVITPVQVNGDSMYNTLSNNDIMLLDKISYRFSNIERFDIVVLNYNDKHLIKRVIGLPGDTVKIIENKLYINDEYVEEKFLSSSVITEDYELQGKVPDGYYFVMGDNRSVSLDSRRLGVFSKSKIEGKTSFTIFPFSHFGSKK